MLPHSGGIDDVARHPHHEQVAEALVENDFRRQTGIRAAHHDRERSLELRDRQPGLGGVVGCIMRGSTKRWLPCFSSVSAISASEMLGRGDSVGIEMSAGTVTVVVAVVFVVAPQALNAAPPAVAPATANNARLDS